MKEILSGQESDQDTGMQNISEVGFDSSRTVINDGEQPLYFERERTTVFDDNGRLGRINESRVWDCGHSSEIPMGGIDSFGHVVCIHCLRWCDRGKHPCCVLDSKLLRNGKRVCHSHRWLKRFFKPKFKRNVER